MANAKNRRIIDEVEKIFIGEFDCVFSERFRHDIEIKFVPKLSKRELIEAAKIAFYRMNNPEDATLYFCGVCWNKIDEKVTT